MSDAHGVREALKGSHWEQAKGQLKAMIAVDPDGDKDNTPHHAARHHDLKVLIGDFIAQIEAERLHQ